uniref:Uncharacterized protein n=1 Tax=Rhizophora mucronata TaxID=61149 RepID=A0A2P2IH14_RHIMU
MIIISKEISGNPSDFYHHPLTLPSLPFHSSFMLFFFFFVILHYNHIRT